MLLLHHLPGRRNVNNECAYYFNRVVNFGIELEYVLSNAVQDVS